jgi:type II secretory pathway component PulF
MSETGATSKLSNFISKYWIWLVMFFGIIGVIALLWYLHKQTSKTKEKQ